MLPPQAVDWWERAAGEALERGAQLEALRLFGEKRLSALPDQDEATAALARASAHAAVA